MKRSLMVWLLCSGVGMHGLSQDKSSLRQLHETSKQNFTESQKRVADFLKTAPTSFFYGDSIAHLVDITPTGQPVYRIVFNAGAAKTTGADLLHDATATGIELLGDGMSVAVWDNGLVKNHVELGNRLLSTEGDSPADHATHVTGTLIASGINPMARGMAPKATAQTYFYNGDAPVMSALAKSDQSSLLFSNHSYGTATGWFRIPGGWHWTGDLGVSADEDYRFGFYADRARELDDIASLAPYYSIFWAVGNDRADPGNGTRPADCNSGTGYDCIIPEAVAKNIFTIGAVNKVNTYVGPASVVMGDYSSWGPTDDGRIKPDLVAAGTNLFSLSATGENTYTTYSGTSMATPNAMGSLLLVQELFSRLHGGRFMKSASLKALAIHTAKEAGPFPGPDYSFGWGLVDVVAASGFLKSEDKISLSLEELNLKNSETFRYSLTPRANTKVTATIVWTDPSGSPVSPAVDPLTPMLVNDLDLRIVDELGVEQKPWILDPLNPARQATHGDNFRDNVEKVEFLVSQSKLYNIVVSHKGHMKGDSQDFSFVLSYASTDAQTTYYWVGDSGNWNDGNHWSLISGGTPALVTPGEDDRIIVDENSFLESGTHEIEMSDNVTVSALRWMAVKTGVVLMNGRSLTVKDELVVSTRHSIFENGAIHCASTTEGVVSWDAKEFQNVKVVVDAGKWSWRGDADLDVLQVDGGEIIMKNSSLKTRNFNANTGTQKKIDLRHCTLSIAHTSDINSQSLELTSSQSTLLAGPDVELNWVGVNWEGKLVFTGAGNRLKGDNDINVMELAGELDMHGSNRIDSLVANAGSTLLVAEGKSLYVNTPVFSGNDNSLVSIQGSTNSNLEFLKHEKFCFDFININSIASVGTGVVTVGINSHLTDAPNWLQQNCADVLFSDFKASYPCQGGVLELTDLSQGAPTQWSWSRTDGGFIGSTDSQKAFVRLVESGASEIKLKVQKGTQSNEVIKSIEVLPNSIGENEILRNEEQLVSFLSATRYQWIKDGEWITDATSRVFDSKGEEGLYQVVVYDDVCSKISQDYIITGFPDAMEDKSILYPNPASQEVYIRNSEPLRTIVLYDLLGKQVFSGTSNHFSVEHLADGLYLSVVQFDNQVIKKKLLIKK